MDLVWEAPADCPTAVEIGAEVKRIVGPSERRHVVVRAVARKDDRGWTLELRTRAGDDEGERTLQGATCVEVARAAVVVIALTIDPNVLAAPPPPPPPPPPPLPPPRPSGPPVGRAWYGVLRAGGGASFLTPPGVAPLAWLAAGLRTSRFAAHAGAAIAFETSEATALPGAGGSFWLLALSGRVCAAPWLAGRFEAWTCAGLEVDRLAGRGFGVTDPRQADVWWVAPLVELGPMWVLSPPLRLVVPLEAAFPLDRTTFRLEGVGPVFQPPPVMIRLSLAAELRF